MFYTSILKQGNSLLVRYIDDDGIRHRTKVTQFEPQVFIQSKRDTGWTDLHSIPLEPKRFDDIKEYSEFVKGYSGVAGMKLYDVPVESQYIWDKYPKMIDWDYNLIKKFFIDIEVKVGNEFPDPNKAEQEITAITIYDSISRQYLVFGSQECGFQRDDVRYFNCGNEKKLLTAFVTFWESNPPDIVTGWNIEGFDIPYLINRMTQLFSEDFPKRLSPWNRISSRPSRDPGKRTPDITIVGVEILDFLDLYKKYVPIKQESYRLDYIAESELGENKVDYESLGYSGLQDLFERNFDLYIEYNVKDVELVVRLERKLKMIMLQCNLAYKAKINYNDAFSPVRLWTALIKNELWYDNKILYDPNSPGELGEYEGAYVKEPIPGMYEWVVSLDATSMYPTAIISYNISPETMVMPEEVPEELVDYYRISHVENLSNWKFDPKITKALVKYNFSMAANGQMYRNDVEGLLPRIVNRLFDERKATKTEMLRLKKGVEAGTIEDTPEIQDDIGGLSITEKGIKVCLNALYGAMGQRFFPLYEIYNAEAITLAGQAAIRAVGSRVSDYVNKLAGTDKDNVIYTDTDSMMIDMSNIISKFPEKDVNKIIDVLVNFADTKLNVKSKEFCHEYGAQLNMRSVGLEFKREKVMTKIIFMGKKRYITYVGDSEGVRYKKLDLVMVGVETNRSSTPKFVRGKLEEAFHIILGGTNDELLDFVEDVEDSFNKLSVMEISFPRGVNGLAKYSHRTNIYEKGNGINTPIHVRASLLYNHWIKQKGLTNYPPIYEGNKIRFVYLKPNYTKENVIAFTEEGLPEELNLGGKVDRSLQFEKSFLEPLKNVTEKIGWKHERSSDLSAFF